MRAKIKIVGLGLRKTGTSKKNNSPYDFVPVSFVYSDKSTQGLKAATANLNGDEFDAAGLSVNDEREAIFHEMNNVHYIDGII